MRADLAEKNYHTFRYFLYKSLDLLTSYQIEIIFLHLLVCSLNNIIQLIQLFWIIHACESIIGIFDHLCFPDFRYGKTPSGFPIICPDKELISVSELNSLFGETLI